MVNKKTTLIVLGTLAIIGLILFYPTEKRKIKKLLKNSAEWAQKTEEDNALSIAVKAKKSRKFFAEKVLLKVERREIEREISIDDIEKGYLYLMSSNSRFKVTIKDIDIEFKDNSFADVVSTVIVESRGGSLEVFSNVNEIVFGVIKTDDGWKINRIEIKEVLEK